MKRNVTQATVSYIEISGNVLKLSIWNPRKSINLLCGVLCSSRVVLMMTLTDELKNYRTGLQSQATGHSEWIQEVVLSSGCTETPGVQVSETAMTYL
jgi:hypothetical protein